jgi:hypothetical protein
MEETLNLLVFQNNGERRKRRRRQDEEKRRSEVEENVSDVTFPSNFFISFVAFAIALFLSST